MKRLYLTETQSNYICESIERKNTIGSLPMFIQTAIDNSTTPLSSVLDKTVIESAVAERTMELRSMFKDDISKVSVEAIERKLNKLLDVCTKKEKAIKEQLEQLCYNTIVQLFNIPKDGITFQCNIIDSINQLPHKNVLSNNGDESNQPEIDKRRLINSLLMGGSMVIAENARPLYINELFDIDEELPHLYSKIIKVNDYLMLIKDSESNGSSQNGMVKVELGNGETNTEITAKATNFPILLIESIRGFLELVASHGLPDEINVANSVMLNADNVSDEPWLMRIGPYVWNEIIQNFEGIDTTDLPYVFEVLVKQPTNKFFSIINHLIYKGDENEKLVAKIIDAASYKKNYNDYNGEILLPSTEKASINDSLDNIYNI